jgi:tetratricopeptide (TPR) repeat protein
MLLDFNLSFDKRVAEERLGGTLPYMAPEHLRATDVERGVDPSLVDARSDVFSLGVILFELLAGVNPFGRIPPNASVAEVRAHLLQRQQAGPNPLRRANAHVDRSLARVIERCLAFDPKDRYASADELAAVLRINLSGWKPVRWVRVHRRVVLRTALAMLVVGGTGSYLLSLVEPPHVRHLRSGLEAYRDQDYPGAAEAFSQAAALVPDNPWIWFARGRSYQQQATLQWVRREPSGPLFRKALEDYERAGERTKDPRILVCMGVCNSFLPSHPKAIQQYQQAMDAGLKSAEVFNNQGYSYLQRGQLEEAKECLDQAIASNPAMAAAYHNRAWVRLHRLMQANRPAEGQADIQTMLADIQTAVALSPLNPETSQLYADAACMSARAARDDEALSYGSRATDHGQDPVALRKALHQFSASRQFMQLCRKRPVGKPLQTLRVVDPIPGIPTERLFSD